jgi:anaphase-promoting complex subunit 8
MTSEVDVALGVLRQVHTEQKYRELKEALRESLDRGLVLSARWLGELVASLGRKLEPQLLGNDAETVGTKRGESDLFFYGKALFDAREYLRAASILEACTSKLGRFLRWYSLFLHGEKRKEEMLLEVSPAGCAAPCKPQNTLAASIVQEMDKAVQSDASLPEDAYICWLRGTALKACGCRKEALCAFIEALQRKPYLWAAWTALHELGEDYSSIISALRTLLETGKAWMFAFFLVMQSGTCSGETSIIPVLQALSSEFPDSVTLLHLLAHAHFSAHDFETAAELCRRLRELDPYFLDAVDLYSNILFVQEDQATLSTLARDCVQIDKYRAETCCVVGNYFALRQNHEKAVQYFRRALTLNRSYTTAWILMGHEFLEMRNTSAAVEAYRRAIDLDPADFRPYYGLGQTYELLHMPHYALYYFEKAATLRPCDDRMWAAVSQALQDIGRLDDAVRCLEKALTWNPDNWSYAKRAGDLFWETGQYDSAAKHYATYLEIRRALRAPHATIDTDEADVIVRMMTYLRQRGELKLANEYLEYMTAVESAEKRETMRKLACDASDPAL